MGWEKFQIDAGNLFHLLVQGGDQQFLVLVELLPPLVVRLQIDEVLGIEEARGIGAVIRPAHLRDDFRDLGKPGEGEACLIHDADALAGSGAGGQRAARPDGAFVEVGKELGADHAARHQSKRRQHRPPRRPPG